MTERGCLQKPWVAQFDVWLASIALDEVCRPPQLLELTWVAAVLHLLTFVQIEELNVASSGPSGAWQSYLVCLTVLLIGILDVWTAALDAAQGK